MLSVTRKLTLGLRRSSRLFSSGNPRPSSSSKFFDDRTLGIITLLVSVPTAAYIWKHHKSVTNSEQNKFIKTNTSESVKISDINSVNRRKIKYLIIGGGAAGFSAIQAIKGDDPDAEVILVSKEESMPYLRPPLSKELWFESKESTIENYDSIEFTDWKGNTKPISFENSEFYKKMGVELILGTEATSLDSEKHEVSLSNGTVLEFERLLIATGAEPKCLDVPIDEYVRSRVLTFRTVSDFANLNNLLKTSSGKKIVVIGGGFLGSELAVSISRFGSNLGHKVTQIFPEDGNMALVFPKYLSRWTTEKVSSLGVTVRSGRLVTCIERNELEDGDRLRLVLDNGEKVEADHVIVAVGVDPSFNKMFGASSLPLNEETGGVEADRYLRVAPDVFAAGDVVSYVDPILNCRRRTEHFDHAILSGKLAGQNMVRSISKDSTVLLEPYANESMFWSDLGPDVGYEAVGVVDSSLTTVGVWARANAIETPKGTEFDSSDIRVQSIGQTSVSSVDSKSDFSNSISDESVKETTISTDGEESGLVPEIPSLQSEQISPNYGKGVVFYVKDRRIVAKAVLREGRGVDEISQCVRLFNVEEVA